MLTSQRCKLPCLLKVCLCSQLHLSLPCPYALKWGGANYLSSSHSLAPVITYSDNFAFALECCLTSVSISHHYMRKHVQEKFFNSLNILVSRDSIFITQGDYRLSDKYCRIQLLFLKCEVHIVNTSRTNFLPFILGDQSVTGKWIIVLAISPHLFYSRVFSLKSSPLVNLWI